MKRNAEEARRWAQRLLDQVGQPIGPYSDEPLTVADIRPAVAQIYGDEIADRLVIKVTYH